MLCRTWCIRLSKYSYIAGAEHVPSNWDLTTEQDGNRFAELLKTRFERVRFCYEVGGGTSMPHWHYLAQNSAKRVNFDTIKKLNKYAHIEAWRCGARLSDYLEYMNKQGTAKGDSPEVFEEFPEMKHRVTQGMRADWLEVREMFENGAGIDDVIAVYPHLSLNVGALERLRFTILSKVWSSKLRLDLDVTYIYGEAGSGKSRFVLERYGLTNCYRVTDYKHPFDGYSGQSVIVFEEFRNSLPFEQMLNYLDIYPCELPSRYSNKIACFTKVFILSNWEYAQQFESIREKHTDSIGAWDRRIHYIFKMEKGGFLTTLKSREFEQIEMDID